MYWFLRTVIQLVARGWANVLGGEPRAFQCVLITFCLWIFVTISGKGNAVGIVAGRAFAFTVAERTPVNSARMLPRLQNSTIE
jgi:hypothetical protein